MLKWLLENIKGDKTIWALVLMSTLFSFLAVYSTSTNLVYVVGRGTTAGYLFKHIVFMGVGAGTLFVVHRVPYRFFRPIAKLGLPVAVILLLIANALGTNIEGVSASRWINFGIFSFQPSTFALVVLMMYVASYLAKNYGKKLTFKETLLPLWTPVSVIIGLVVFSNLSTALLITGSVFLLCFLGRFPMKHILTVMVIGLLFLLLSFLVIKAYPEIMPSRFKTWENRVESFMNKEENKEGYQIERSKMAIAKGGIFGQGAGKSTMKNFLPQSSSDFIYAIITEEYGLVGAFSIMLLYIVLLMRIVVISQKAPTLYGQLLVLGVGLPIILQALINMGVAVELLPVTGQNLPLISSGGTSIWMTCLALGCILSVSAHKRKEEGKMETDKPEADVEEELAEDIIKITKK